MELSAPLPEASRQDLGWGVQSAGLPHSLLSACRATTTSVYCRSYRSLFSKPGINESCSHPPSRVTCFTFACLDLWSLRLQSTLVILLATLQLWPWSPRLRCPSSRRALILPRLTSVHASLHPNVSDAWHPGQWKQVPVCSEPSGDLPESA